MSSESRISKLRGVNKVGLLNLKAQMALEKMGHPDWYQTMEQVSNNTQGSVQPYEIYLAASRESGFDPNAQSKISSAAGLGQFVKGTAESLGLNNPMDPHQSIHAMGRYLADLKNTIGSDDPLAAQKAYMLGGTGYKRMLRGDPTVKGLKDLPALVSKFNNDVALLGGEGVADNLEIARAIRDSKATPHQMQGRMTQYQPEVEEEISIEGLNNLAPSRKKITPKIKPAKYTPAKAVVLGTATAPTELGSIAGLGSITALEDLGQLDKIRG